METEALNVATTAGLNLVSAPIIIFIVNIAKRAGLQSEDAPFVAGIVGSLIGVSIAFEMGGTSVMNALVGIALGIGAGLSAVGLHTISQKQKPKDESGTYTD